MNTVSNDEMLKRSLSDKQYRKMKQEEKVKWIVNDLGELGVKVGGVFYFMYKGESLIYSEDSDNAGMKVRPVGKREFGESGPKVDGYDINNFHNDEIKPLPLFS